MTSSGKATTASRVARPAGGSTAVGGRRLHAGVRRGAALGRLAVRPGRRQTGIRSRDRRVHGGLARVRAGSVAALDLPGGPPGWSRGPAPAPAGRSVEPPPGGVVRPEQTGQALGERGEPGARTTAAYAPSDTLLTNTRFSTTPRSTRRSTASPKASSAAAGSSRSSPRSRAKWVRVPAGTQTKGSPCRRATSATTAWQPSPPATPSTSAPSATACSASSRRSSSRPPGWPSTRARSPSRDEVAAPLPDKGSSRSTPVRRFGAAGFGWRWEVLAQHCPGDRERHPGERGRGRHQGVDVHTGQQYEQDRGDAPERRRGHLREAPAHQCRPAPAEHAPGQEHREHQVHRMADQGAGHHGERREQRHRRDPRTHPPAARSAITRTSAAHLAGRAPPRRHPWWMTPASSPEDAAADRPLVRQTGAGASRVRLQAARRAHPAQVTRSGGPAATMPTWLPNRRRRHRPAVQYWLSPAFRRSS